MASVGECCQGTYLTVFGTKHPLISFHSFFYLTKHPLISFHSFFYLNQSCVLRKSQSALLAYDWLFRYDGPRLFRGQKWASRMAERAAEVKLQQSRAVQYWRCLLSDYRCCLSGDRRIDFYCQLSEHSISDTVVFCRERYHSRRWISMQKMSQNTSKISKFFKTPSIRSRFHGYFRCFSITLKGIDRSPMHYSF